MFTLDGRRVPIPDGCLIISSNVAATLPISDLRENWLRTRERNVIEILENPTAKRVFPEGREFAGIRMCLESMSGELDGEDVNPVIPELGSAGLEVWEFQFPHGHIRRGHPLLPSDYGTTVGSTQEGVATGLRALEITEIKLPEGFLTNHVASYLGKPSNLEVGWLTSAPVTGSTPNWNGKEVRRLTWSGHGNSFRESHTAALLEGIERRAGALEDCPRSVISTANELTGRTITPHDFPPYPEEFYGHLGAQFDPDDPHEWVDAENLSGHHTWIPREYVYYGEQMTHHLWALGTSSGCATGSSIAEARLFGILELIERDSFVASWYAGIDATPIRISGYARYRSVLARAALLGIRIRCGLLPSIIGIPTVVASAEVAEPDGIVLSIGAACHPSIESAIGAAINEAWTYIDERVRAARAMHDRVVALRANPRMADAIDDHPMLAIYPHEQAYLNVSGTGEERSIDENPAWFPWVNRSPEQLLEHIVERLRANGIDVWFHTQTSGVEHLLGLETVMTIAPSLLPIDFGWAQQRALHSDRLAAIVERHHGSGAQPRNIPHPFS